MATRERRFLEVNLDKIHSNQLPDTASAVGIDLNTGKQIYYNTSSNNWSIQTAFTGSVTKLTDGSDYLIASGAVTLTTTSLGAVKVHVFEESGNWTPALSFSGVNTGHAYSSRVGRYYKIGRNIIANFAISLSALGGDSGNVLLVDLPFISETAGDGTGDGMIPAYKNLNNTDRVSGIQIHLGSTTTKADIYHVTNPDTESQTLTHSNLTDTTELTGSVRYICAT
jgi:hypothetical protein